MPDLNLEAAREVLERLFTEVEGELLEGTVPSVDPRFNDAISHVFRSSTQSYREILLGCILARLQDKSIDIHLPYVGLGENSYHGRKLDEDVVNPFLHAHQIPSTRGAFLAVFRRSVSFVPETREGLKDTAGYDSLLILIDYLAQEVDDGAIESFLKVLLAKLVEVREGARIELINLQRLSADQYGALIDGLLARQSGGRFPVMLVAAAFEALRERFHLPWEIQTQGINVADLPSKFGGDIVILEGDRTVLAAEVTERRIDKERVVATFQAKIGPQGIDDYLFFVTADVDESVMRQSRQYFTQGHEVSFVLIKGWILAILLTIGPDGRRAFNNALLERLSDSTVPSSLKAIWNELMVVLTEV